jgi:hypothetical protein
LFYRDAAVEKKWGKKRLQPTDHAGRPQVDDIVSAAIPIAAEV